MLVGTARLAGGCAYRNIIVALPTLGSFTTPALRIGAVEYRQQLIEIRLWLIGRVYFRSIVDYIGQQHECCCYARGIGLLAPF